MIIIISGLVTFMLLELLRVVAVPNIENAHDLGVLYFMVGVATSATIMTANLLGRINETKN